MVDEITKKVLGIRRDISKKEKQDQLDSEQIIVVSTHEADSCLIKAVKDSEETLKRTQSFRDQNGPLFKYVKKVGPNIRSKLNTMKKQALGIATGSAMKCNGAGCKCCKMIMTKSFVTIRERKVKLLKGNCKTYNTCYLGQCRICQKPYTGRSVGAIHKRVSGQSSKYKGNYKTGGK